jgi:benzoate/toluate 1,2-dioxygenase reductase subunit
MPFTIALNFEDWVTRFIDARDGETVADAAYRVGINIPLDCRDGACGACKVKVETGSFDGGCYIEDALSVSESEAGYALACQMKPKTDLTLSVATSAAACRTRIAECKARIESVDRLSSTALAFTLAFLGPAPPFLPGQYVNIKVPETSQSRSYSFASRPNAHQARFLMRDIPGGVMTSFITGRSAVGAEVDIAGPVGSFYLRALDRPVLMLAGGTGLAPFLSMLAYIGTDAAGTHPIHLVYGVTRDEDLVEVDKLQDFAERIPGFTFTTCVAAAESTHPKTGFVTAHITPVHLNDGNVDVYLCGPPAMVEAVRAAFAADGVKPATFRYEKFSPSGTMSEVTA